MTVCNALTIDVEDYYQVTAFEPYVSREDWDRHESRVVCNTHRLLSILAKRDVCATFFVLGWVADRFPELVRSIRSAGHEIGSHSYWHRQVFTLTPDEFRDDLRESCDALRRATGEDVRMFRAPTFSIRKGNLWALDILAQEGIEIDSSIFPGWHDRYGIPDADPAPHVRRTRHGDILEMPPAVLRVGKISVPCAGGGYFRMFPFAASAALMRRINRTRPFVFYLHPWELDHEQPRLNVGSRWTRERHYRNLAAMETKLDRLLAQFRFGKLSDVASAVHEGAVSRPDLALAESAHIRATRRREPRDLVPEV